MAREEWASLNGLWDYAVCPEGAGRPEAWDGEILVPFPIESSLSGVGRRVGEREILWYRRRFVIPESWAGKRILLHLDAVDWEARVRIDGHEAGLHRGGYDRFTCDITPFLRSGEAAREHEIVVSVWDSTDAGDQARGKQVRRPHGIWYTPTTGIWQTVWIEPVPEEYIRSLRILPVLEDGVIRLTVETNAPDDRPVKAEVVGGLATVSRVRSFRRDTAIGVPVADDPRLWTPDDPFLYDLEVTLGSGEDADRVRSYFGMRSVSVEKDRAGIVRIHLNGKPTFLLGPLDQGFWPDGLYAAPTDEALRYDVEMTKRLGFNAVRKHVKAEPERWYHWCDRIGLVVLQDMPSGDAFVRPGEGEIRRSAQSARQFEAELRRVIEQRANHPSIVMWIPFNEGWGQYDTARIVELVREVDPTRLVTCASGWNDFPVGDVQDVHAYPGPAAPRPEDGRAAVLGEFGGLGLPIAGHTWQDEENWGYRSFENREALTGAYVALVERLRGLIAWPGLSAAIYTQTTDVEIEVNGLLTYDRAIVKMDRDRVAAANGALYRTPDSVRIVAPTAFEDEVVWRYTTETPPDGWEAPGFDDSGWDSGRSGFGTDGTPGARVRTEWSSSDLWIRRSFDLDEGAFRGAPVLLVHHDEGAEIHVNGVLATRLEGYSTSYVLVEPSEEARAALRSGRVTLAAHVRQTGGGQYLDIGLADRVEGER
jgi:hypothetical protein